MCPYDGGFDANLYEPSQGGGPHPKGKFPTTISNTSIKPTKSGDGGLFEVEFSTQAGTITNRYNLWNKEPKAVEIAQKELSALCYATGIFKLDFRNDGAALRGAKLIIEIDDQKNKDGTPNGYVEVKKVYDASGNEPGRQTPPAQPQQASQGATGAPTGTGGGWGQPAQNNAPAAAPSPQAWAPRPTENTAPSSKPPWS